MSRDLIVIHFIIKIDKKCVFFLLVKTKWVYIFVFIFIFKWVFIFKIYDLCSAKIKLE